MTPPINLAAILSEMNAVSEYEITCALRASVELNVKLVKALRHAEIRTSHQPINTVVNDAVRSALSLAASFGIGGEL